MRKTAVSLLVAGLVVVVGCRGGETPRVPDESRPVRAEAAEADDYVAAIRSAPTAAAEADAIRALRRWEVRNGLTYQVETVRLEDGAPVRGASVGDTPVRATVTIFRGREVVRTFRFTPRDNRNLALLGE
jgi:hypothetical protein